MPVTRTVPAVCPISRNQALPLSPGLRIPPIPRVVDLPSAIQAANTISNILNVLALPGSTPVNNVWPPLPQGYVLLTHSTFNGDPGKPIVAGQARAWSENMRKRQTEREKIYKNNDKQSGVWIEIERITHMELKDPMQGDSLVFDYHQGSSAYWGLNSPNV